MAAGLSPTPRPVAASIEELIGGAAGRRPFRHTDGKSGSTLERLEIHGEPHVLKHLHPDDDWTMRGFGDLGCRPVEVWTSGLLKMRASSITIAEPEPSSFAASPQP